MSNKTQTTIPTTKEEANEWLEETYTQLTTMREHLDRAKDAKILGLPFANLNDTKGDSSDV